STGRPAPQPPEMSATQTETPQVAACRCLRCRWHRTRATYYQAERQRAVEVRTWTDKINAHPDAPQSLRDLAASMGPLADKTTARAEAAYAEPDDLYVARVREQHETYVQVSGPPGAPDYRYPAHLTGPGAADYPPPPEAQAGHGIEPGA